MVSQENREVAPEREGAQSRYAILRGIRGDQRHRSIGQGRRRVAADHPNGRHGQDLAVETRDAVAR